METFDGPGRTRQVLVVDDDDDCATLLVLLLEHDGHEVRTAFDGRTALEAVDGFRPDVVILDLLLSDMTGYQLAAALRDRTKTEASILVALTGLDGDEVRDKCRGAGFDCHIVKPILDFERFRALVRSLEVHEDLRLT